MKIESKSNSTDGKKSYNKGSRTDRDMKQAYRIVYFETNRNKNVLKSYIA